MHDPVGGRFKYVVEHEVQADEAPPLQVRHVEGQSKV